MRRDVLYLGGGAEDLHLDQPGLLARGPALPDDLAGGRGDRARRDEDGLGIVGLEGVDEAADDAALQRLITELGRQLRSSGIDPAVLG